MKRIYRGIAELSAQAIQKLFDIKPQEMWASFSNKAISPQTHKWTYNSEIGAIFSATDQSGGMKDRPAGGFYDVLLVGESEQEPTSPESQTIDWSKVKKGKMVLVGAAIVKSDGSFEEKKAKLQSMIPGFSPKMKDVFKRKSNKPQ